MNERWDCMVVKGKMLRPGDTIALVSPASPVHPDAHVSMEMLELARKRLHEMGLRTVLSPNALKLRGYLAGQDGERAADLMWAFENPEVDGIVCIQGGYGTPRILPLLDYGIIASHPKVFVGYSDITGIHCAMAKLANLVTFHGPMAGYDMSKEFVYTREWFARAVMRPERLGELSNPPEGPALATICPGRVTAPIIGGNLSLLVATLGTPYQIDTTGKILLFEDVGEVTYRFDRMLTHLKLAGKLEAAAGFIIAECVDCGPGNTRRPMLTLDEVIGDLIAPLGKPALYGLAAGHGQRRLTIPLGVQVTLDATRCTVTVEESGVEP